MENFQGFLQDYFFESQERVPDNIAVRVAGVEYTYAEVGEIARNWAAALRQATGRQPRRVGVFAGKDLAAYAGILAVLYAGATVIPLNPAFPAARSRRMLRSGRIDAIISGDQEPDRTLSLVENMDNSPSMVLPFVRDELLHRADVIRGSGTLAASAVSRCQAAPGRECADSDEAAYILFTSGTTGEPKGIPISHRNVTHFIETASELYRFTERDRFSQTFDLTFDLSFFDMFMAWRSGGCLFPLSPGQLLESARFIRDNALTVWFSVPSVVALMRKRRSLRPGSLDTLRWSLFCGEALPAAAAAEWHAAAPSSIIENLYGPTEATIACMRHRWHPQKSPPISVNGCVPIGVPYAGTRTVVVDDTLSGVEAGSDGELCVAGPQVFSGYWDRPDETRAKLVRLPGDAEGPPWYRTGDIVRQLPVGDYAFLGRVDGQVKVGGYRVEIAEIEALLNCHPGVIASAVVVAPPQAEEASPDTPFAEIARLVAFVVTDSQALGAAGTMSQLVEDIIQAVRLSLPSYMVPARIIITDEFPLNPNGKIDRQGLSARAAASTDQHGPASEGRA